MRRLLPFRDRPTVEHQVYDLPARESCDRCNALLEGEPDFTYFRICPVCGRHFGISASRRIAYLADPDSFEERSGDLYSTDPLGFSDDEPYLDRLAVMQERTKRSDGMTVGTATIGGEPVVLAVLDFTFLGGSMGVVVGERLARAAELAAGKKRPLIAAVASGGARMQEGMLSLLQMAKTASSIAALKDEGVPFVSILSDPTTGGVLASFASLADIIVAEPEALIGFAGPRVIEQTLGRSLPSGSHTAEFQFAHGMVDAVVARPDQRNYLIPLLHALRAADAPKPEADTGAPLTDQRSAWEIVEGARATNRPSTRAYLERISPGYVELHGDREWSDDLAVVTAIGRIDGVPVALTGFDRFAPSELGGANGRPMPGGFRKAQRLLGLAERWKLPVVSFVDTPGAYPGVEAEASGLAGEIARTLERMSSVEIPTIAVIVGEGGSGGALALALADKVLIQSGAFFSVIGPEGAATILHRDASRAPELAESLRITAPELLALGIVDHIVPEPAGGAAADFDEAAKLLETAIVQQLVPLRKRRTSRLLKARRTRYRTIGMTHIDGRPPLRHESAEPEDGTSLSG
ncbi:MAG TPA: acetyl-CoA carboxylase carboxyltransferase subunit alpha/beta [Thermomicrobiales bacterium]|nr:acetyl-CoA carboxylase carboxyltransferase subunit alpha/beta [Thermomicrobiales bacterium]